MVIVLIGIGIYSFNKFDRVDVATTPSPTTSAEVSPTPATAQEVTYQGQEGKTALALLEENAEVKTKGEGANAFVSSINGYAADSAKKEFWAFYLNGESATVGAGSYDTKDTDTITWKIQTY